MLGALPGETRVTARPLAGARFLVLLSPLLVGTLVTIIRGEYTRTPGTPVFVAWALLYTAILLLVSYASVLIYNGVRVALRKGTTVKAWVLLGPVILGVVFTILTGLASLVTADIRPGENYEPYGFPLYWYRSPNPYCNPLTDGRFQCMAEFSISFFLFDALVFVGLYLLLSYFSTLVYNAVPLSKNRRWPFFLPRLPVRDRTESTDAVQ